MRPELLAILACPYCFSAALSYSDATETGEERLVCRHCKHTYRFENHIPLLHRDDESWAPKHREAQGWVSLWKEIGIYDLDHQVAPNLPFVVDEPWATVGRMFRAALFQMDLRGHERILDIGAGEGWASQHFAARGCHAVAIDVVPDMQHRAESLVGDNAHHKAANMDHAPAAASVGGGPVAHAPAGFTVDDQRSEAQVDPPFA